MGLVYATAAIWTTVLLWQMLSLTHSGLWVTLAVGAGAVPPVVVGLTGPGWGPRASTAAWLGGLAAAMAIGAPWYATSPWALVVVALVEAWVGARLVPTAQAWMMAHVGVAEAPRASTRFERASRVGMLAGPLVAGAALTTLGAVVGILLAALVLGAAAVVWRQAGFHELSQRSAGREPAGGHAWQIVRADGFLLTALGLRAGANLLWHAYTVVLPLMIQET